MSRNGKIHTKKRQFRQMPVLAFLNQRLFLQPLFYFMGNFVEVLSGNHARWGKRVLPFLSITTREYVKHTFAA